MDVFFHSQELDGITRDPRFVSNPGGFARLSVVCQLLGYLELNRSTPETHMHRADIVDRADFLVEHFDLVHTGQSTDGMLGYALLGAWEVTGDPRYLEKGQQVVEDAKLLQGFQVRLNWGLMAGMALARAWRMSGDFGALQQLDLIVENIRQDALPDGSFPHVCRFVPDVHYTGWITMELITIARELDDPARMALATRSAEFLAARVGPGGATEYTAPCATCPGFVSTYWSVGGGCEQDYDTRGWVNELGYLALAFDEFRDPRYEQVMAFLASLEDHGAFPDKWDWWPLADDPAFAYGSSPRSVVRTSILFWTLASILSNRESPAASGSAYRVASASDVAPLSSTPSAGFGAVEDSTGRLSWDASRSLLRFSLAAPASIQLDLYDVRGRRVRRLLHGHEGSGSRRVAWDHRDDSGRSVSPGLYFARLVSGERRESVRLSHAP